MLKYTLLGLILFPAVSLFGQDLDHFVPLQSSGKVPEDFTMHTMAKVKRDIANIPYKDNYSERGAKQEFLLNSNYELDELLMSGRILFNDPVSAYVARVADVVLAGETGLRSKIRFYCLKSNEANAFSTNPGIIFVTTGLISRLENESQLAFIICHEIVHYKNKHPMNLYVQQVAQDKKYKYSSVDDRISSISRFSKENEMEADNEGFELFKKSGYRLSEAKTVLEILLYSDLSFINEPFDYSFLETSGMKIPHYYKGEVPVKYRERDKDYDDSKSTHPNIRTRDEQIDRNMKDLDPASGDLFKVSEKEFLHCRELCRFQSVKQNLDRFEYTDAVYHAASLLKKYPGNSYLEISMAKALYGMAKFKAQGSFGKMGTGIDIDDPQGHIVSSHRLFSSFTSDQLTSVALRYVITVNAKHKSAFLALLEKDLVNDLLADQVTFDSIKYRSTVKVKELTFDTTNNRRISGSSERTGDRVQRIEIQKKASTGNDTDEEVNTENFHFHAFDDMLETAYLSELFAQVSNQRDERKKSQTEEDDQFNKMSSYEKRKLKNQKQKEIKMGYHYDISKFVVVDPFYLAKDERKGVKRMSSEDRQISLNNQILEVAAAAGYDVTLLSSKTVTDTSAGSFNDMSIYNEWVTERLDQEVDMIPLNTEYAMKMADKYGTEYACFTGVLTVKRVKDRGGCATLIYAVLFPPALPVLVTYMCLPSHATLYYVLVYNVKNGEVVLNEQKIIPVKAKKGYINSLVYELLLRIKK